MESLSPDLLLRLRSLGLCRPRDLRRSRARVRRLSRDLPAFDSVWLDALVQLRRLTPYQARVCMNGDASSLAVGPYVLLDRLPGDGRLESCIARRPGDPDPVCLTTVALTDADRDAVLHRLQQLVPRMAETRAPQLLVPRTVTLDGDRLVVVGPHVAGLSCHELLVRRGRFPVAVVTDIARQIAAALEALEQRGLVHGDLRLRNLRLDPAGRLHLSHPGLLAALEPWITIHTDVPPDVYDGVAPELIDTRAERSIASELYALGCLMWQLLAGRPPFPAADVLVKLAAHQTRRVEDVRQWSPDAPPHLAGLIQRLTSPDPRQRPKGFAEALDLLGRPPAHRSRRLRKFIRSFQSAAPRQTGTVDPASRLRPALAAAAVLVVLTGGLWLHSGWRSQLQRLANAAVQAPKSAAVDHENAQLAGGRATPPAPAAASAAAVELPPLPEPLRGVVQLSSDGPYRAQTLAAVGPLSIVGSDGVRPVILVDAAPLRLSGTSVVLQNVTIAAAADRDAAAPLLEVRAQDFGMLNCQLAGASGRRAGEPVDRQRPCLVQWSPIAEGSALGGRIGVRNTLFTGEADALRCSSSPASAQFQHVLLSGGGALLALAPDASARTVQLSLRHVTLRDSRGILSCAANREQRPAALHVIVERCLFGLQPAAGLLELHGIARSAETRETLLACRITGVESFLESGAQLAVQRLPTGVEPLDASEMAVEGLQFSALPFAGPAEEGWRTAAIDAEWSRRSGSVAPGCDVGLFADFPSTAYNPATAVRQSSSLPLREGPEHDPPLPLREGSGEGSTAPPVPTEGRGKGPASSRASAAR